MDMYVVGKRSTTELILQPLSLSSELFFELSPQNAASSHRIKLTWKGMEHLNFKI